jgi:hypothetical protein
LRATRPVYSLGMPRTSRGTLTTAAVEPPTIHRGRLQPTSPTDGLEFAADTPDALAWGVLENLFDHAAVEVHLTDD